MILISLDGTRPADVKAGLPSLVSLGRRGVHAEGLVPVDPTNTFPNHVSLATGVRPEVHRLVNNGFVDPERGQYSQGDPSEPWIEAEPIWSIAERSGIPTASFYWVGSEGPTKNGIAPREYAPILLAHPREDEGRPDPGMARDRRPRASARASSPPGSTAPTTRATTRAPARRRSSSRWRRRTARSRASSTSSTPAASSTSTTLVFVSDHGMASAERRVNLGSLLRKGGARTKVIGIGGFASIYAGPTRRDARSLRSHRRDRPGGGSRSPSPRGGAAGLARRRRPLRGRRRARADRDGDRDPDEPDRRLPRLRVERARDGRPARRLRSRCRSGAHPRPGLVALDRADGADAARASDSRRR